MVLELLALPLALWAFDSVVLAPLLASRALRRLAAHGPTDSRVGNYLLGTLGFALAQVGALLLTVLAAGGSISTGESGPQAFLYLLAPLLAVAVLAAAVCAVVLPARGVWEPDGEGLDGRGVLAAGVLWYALAAGLGMVVLAFVAFLIGFPG